MTTRPITRRSVLGGAAAVGGAAVLAACGSDDDADTTTDAESNGEAEDDADTDDGAAEDDAGADDGDAAGGEALIAAAEVPVGGGVILGASGVVVTQPTEGEFKGFSSTCTHQGCQVSSVEGDTIRCACHNSTFSVDDGSVLGGPATAPLPEVAVAVEGDQVVSG